MEAKEPWWAADPTLAEKRRAALEEIEQAPTRLPVPTGPDPVFVEVASGASRRALADARMAGYSWGELGRVLGVPKQSLHRRFGDLG